MSENNRIDVLYVTRPQVERWSDEELRMNSNLPAAREELEKRMKSKEEEEELEKRIAAKVMERLGCPSKEGG